LHHLLNKEPIQNSTPVKTSDFPIRWCIVIMCLISPHKLLFISMFPWAIPDKTSDFPIRWCIVIMCLIFPHKLLFISMFPWAIPDKTSDFPIRWCIVIICLSHCLYYFQYHCIKLCVLF
jgi:hypothetical protein